jgi:hypothetical protein
MRGKEIGIVAVLAAASFAAAGCGSSKSGASGAAAAASGPTAAAAAASATTEAPSPSPTTTTAMFVPMSGSILLTGLLDASAYGSSFQHVKPSPVSTDETDGSVDDIPGLDCGRVLDEDRARLGSMASARDTLLKDSNADLVRQGAFQFNQGEAATMMANIFDKAKHCATYDSTTTDTTYHEKAVVETVSGLGDQAIKITITDDSPKFGPDTSVEVIARYGDVAVSVDFDAVVASRATSYDVTGKVKAIAAKLRLTATGS